MRLLFIRHGEPDYEHDSLTEVGRVEAELLVPRMQREEITEFFVSPLGRARETARPTLDALGRTAAEYEWLQEFSVPILRPDKDGEYSRVPWDWLPADWLQDPRLLDRLHWRENEIMAAGNVGAAYDRVISGFDELLAAHGYRRSGLLYAAERPNTETLAFFCHFGVTCVFLSHLMNCSPMVLWHGMSAAPSSVTTVYTEERRPGLAAFRTSAFGDVSHLYAEHVKPSFAARFCEVYGDGTRAD